MLLCITNKLYADGVELEWVVPNDYNIIGYNLTMWTESGLSVTTKLNKVNTIKIDSLVKGKKYTFQITPIIKNGILGERSNYVICEIPMRKSNNIENVPKLKVKSTYNK